MDTISDSSNLPGPLPPDDPSASFQQKKGKHRRVPAGRLEKIQLPQKNVSLPPLTKQPSLPKDATQKTEQVAHKKFSSEETAQSQERVSLPPVVNPTSSSTVAPQKQKQVGPEKLPELPVQNIEGEVESEQMAQANREQREGWATSSQPDLVGKGEKRVTFKLPPLEESTETDSGSPSISGSRSRTSSHSSAEEVHEVARSHILPPIKPKNSMRFTNSSITPEDLEQLAKKHPNITRLEFVNCVLKDGSMQALSSFKKRLTELHITNCEFEKKAVCDLSDFRKLKLLDLSGSKGIGCVTQLPPKIHTFNLYAVEGLSNSHFEHLGSTLQEIDLGENKRITRVNLSTLKERSPQLNKLSLRKCPSEDLFNEKGMEALASLTLNTLDLSYTKEDRDHGKKGMNEKLLRELAREYAKSKEVVETTIILTGSGISQEYCDKLKEEFELKVTFQV